MLCTKIWRDLTPYTKNSAGGTMMNWCSLTKMVELSFTIKLSRITINGSFNTFNTDRGGGLMSSMTGLNEIALSLWVVWNYFFFPLLILQLVAGLLVLLSSRAGTPTDSRLVILRVLIFLQRLCQRLLTLWVILFFFFGVLSLREISNAGSNLGDSGILWRSTVPSP